MVVPDQGMDPYLPGESMENHKNLQQEHRPAASDFFFILILRHCQYLILRNVEV